MGLLCGCHRAAAGLVRAWLPRLRWCSSRGPGAHRGARNYPTRLHPPPTCSDLVKKVGSTISSAVDKVAEAITPADKQERRPEQRQRGREDIYRQGG